MILAIIALIATPIILGIINDAKEESDKRSVELYASAVKNGIAVHQLRTGNEILPGIYDQTDETKKLPFEVQVDGEVECEKVYIYEDGNIYLERCTVNGGEKTYTSGTKQQFYKPQYYGLFSGQVEEIAVSLKPSTEPPIGKDVYLGYDMDGNNKVLATYACFTRNGQEYCLKEKIDHSVFVTNTEIKKDAFTDVVDKTEYCILKLIVLTVLMIF